MKALILALLLSGCTPHWYRDMPDYDGKPIIERTADAAELAAKCGIHDIVINGCAKRLKGAPGGQTCLIFLSPTANECTLKHELKHCKGWNHDNRQIYRQDCGEG